MILRRDQGDGSCDLDLSNRISRGKEGLVQSLIKVYVKGTIK